MEIVIKSATREDINGLTDFQIAMALETENMILDHATVHSGINALFEDVKKGEYYVIYDREKLIGCTLTISEWSDWRNGTVLWIHSVYIVPEYRKKGLFRKMYTFLKDKVETDINLRGLRLYVDKSNINAQKVYQALGMNGEHYQLYEWMK